MKGTVVLCIARVYSVWGKLCAYLIAPKPEEICVFQFVVLRSLVVDYANQIRLGRVMRRKFSRALHEVIPIHDDGLVVETSLVVR